MSRPVTPGAEYAGEWMREQKHRSGLTWEKFAERVGTSVKYLQAIAQGKRHLTPAMRERIERAV